MAGGSSLCASRLRLGKPPRGVGRRRRAVPTIEKGDGFVLLRKLGEKESADGANCANAALPQPPQGLPARMPVYTRPRRPCPLLLHCKIQFQPENSFLDRIYRIGAQRRKTANGSPPGEQSESINKSGFRNRRTPQNDPIGFTLIHSPSALFDSLRSLLRSCLRQSISPCSVVSFDSLRSLLQSCLRQSISPCSVVVNSAGFGFKVTLVSIVAALVRCFQSAREDGDF